jgi:type II secretory pathway component PulC
MIQIIIVIISIILLLLLLKEYLSNNFYISDIISNCVSEVFQNKKVFINENENRFILFKRNDSVSDMKILNILYQCQYEDDEKEFIL